MYTSLGYNQHLYNKLFVYVYTHLYLKTVTCKNDAQNSLITILQKNKKPGSGIRRKKIKDKGNLLPMEIKWSLPESGLNIVTHIGNSSSTSRHITLKLRCGIHSELPWPVPRNSVESDYRCTSRIYFDNAGDNMTLTLYNVTLTSQNPCYHIQQNKRLKWSIKFFFNKISL